MSAAKAAERQLRESVTTPSPLADVQYSAVAIGLWLWVAASEDQLVREVLQRYRSAPAEERQSLRRILTMDDFYGIMTFARRRALEALRTRDVSLLGDALQSLAMIEVERVDERDLHIAIAMCCYAAQQVGLPLQSELVAAAAMAQPYVARLLTSGRRHKVNLSKECGYQLIETADGLVLLSDGYKRYKPKADLVRVARGFATVLDCDLYWVHSVSVGEEIPDVWFGLAGRDPGAKAALGRLTGCTRVHATFRPDRTQSPYHPPRLGCWFAEAASAADAQTIVDAAAARVSNRALVRGVAVGRLIGVLLYLFDPDIEPTESRDSLGRFVPAMADILTQAAAA
jgi:hypothetical protein